MDAQTFVAFNFSPCVSDLLHSHGSGDGGDWMNAMGAPQNNKDSGAKRRNVVNVQNWGRRGNNKAVFPPYGSGSAILFSPHGSQEIQMLHLLPTLVIRGKAPRIQF